MSGPVTLVLYDCRSALADKIVEILADWSASGWVSQYATVSLQEVQARGRAISNVLAVQAPTANSATRPQRLLDLLVHREVRLLVLDPAGPTAVWVGDRQDLHRAATTLYQALADKRLGAIDLVVPWHGAYWDQRMIKWSGWDTLLVAPEGATSVSEAGMALHCDPTSSRQVADIAAHAAAFAAAAAGLWSGVPESPFDNTASTDDLRMGRAFHRRMDASAIADRLRSRVLTLEGVRMPDAQLATSVTVFERRRESLQKLIVLVPAPAPPPVAGPTQMAPLVAIRMFLSFMFGRFLRSPREIMATWVYRGKVGAARRLTNSIFGQDSQMAVAVGGISADGLPIGLAERDQRIDSLRATVASIGELALPEGLPAAGQRAFWTATFDTVWALASGASQGSAEAFVDEAVPRYFRADQIAPVLMAPWRADGGLSVKGLQREIPFHDVIATQAAEQLLERAAAAPDSRARVAAERNRKSLVGGATQWNDSFFGRIGFLIADGIGHHDKIIEDLLARLGQVAQTDDSEAEELAGRLSRFSRSFSAVMALVAILMLALSYLQVLVLPLLVTLPIIFLGWLIGMFGKFWSMKKKIFQAQNRARAADAQYDRIVAQLPGAVENAYRLGRLYAQYLNWSEVVSAFLREPFGRATHVGGDFVGMAGSVPRSVSCGVYEVSDETAATRVTAQIALGLAYPISTLWSGFVDCGLRHLVNVQPRFARLKAEDMFGAAEVGQDGALRSWMGVALERSSEGIRPCAAVAHEIDGAQMGRLVRNIAPGQMAELLAAHAVIQVGAGGLALAQRLSLDVRLVDFHRDAFSARGMRARSVDTSASYHLTSQLVAARDTRHWLDEVDTVFVLTPQLSFSDIVLVGAGGLGGGSDGLPPGFDTEASAPGNAVEVPM